MVENMYLSAVQSHTLQDIDAAINDFVGVSMFASTEAVRAKHWAIVTKFIELQSEFPKIAKLASDYYEADFAEEPENLEGYEDALFSFLLTLRSFAVAESFSDFANLKPSLHDHLFDLSTFSEAFDSEHASWKN